jgi:hypothetical protein
MTRKLLVAATWVCCISLPDAVARMARLDDSARQVQAPQSAGAQANAYATAMAGFQKRVEAYLALRARIAEKVPEVKETGDPAKISARERALGEAIAAARASARPGDLIGSDFAPHLAGIVAADWKTRRAADRKALLSEMPAGVTLAIGKPYPAELPLVSVPPALLAKLPTLPEELEYRLVGRHLVLRDRDANVVVDILTNVLTG